MWCVELSVKASHEKTVNNRSCGGGLGEMRRTWLSDFDKVLQSLLKYPLSVRGAGWGGLSLEAIMLGEVHS